MTKGLTTQTKTQSMTSTLLQPTNTTSTTTAAESSAMGWSHDKLRFSCVDNIGLKQLWKLIALDTNANTATAAAAAVQKSSSANVSEKADDKLKNIDSINSNNNNEVSSQNSRKKEDCIKISQITQKISCVGRKIFSVNTQMTELNNI